MCMSSILLVCVYISHTIGLCVEVDPDGVNVQDNHKDTPLHEACNRGILSVVKELLDHNADVNIDNATGLAVQQLRIPGGDNSRCKAPAKDDLSTA